MPKYSWNIEEILFEEDVKAMFHTAKTKREAVLVSLLWLTGGRPDEILSLKPENIDIYTDKVAITIKTLKLKKDGKFKTRERTLVFKRTGGLDTNIYLETIIDYVRTIPPDTRILSYTTRWAELKINKLGEATIKKRISPYHFRHSVFTWFARNGWTIEQIKYWKGAASIASVEPYLHAVPQIVAFENLHRGKTRLKPIAKP